MIYLDSASTSLLKPPVVAQTIAEAICTMGNPGRGVHKHAKNASDCIYAGRKAVAALFGTIPQNTVFTSSATESLNIALRGLLGPNDHVITTALEHNAVLRPLYHLESAGMEISIINIKEDNNLNYAGFENYVKPNTKAVIITAASNLTGLIVDMKFISAFCKKYGLILIVDAAQAAGIIPIDMNTLGIDVLCFTGHKSLYGPQGVGGLCVREGFPHRILPTKFGGAGTDSFSKTQPKEMPEALEAGTLNSHGIAGLLAGIEYINKVGMEDNFTKSLELAREFYKEICTILNVKIYTNVYLPHTPIITLNIGDLDSGTVEFILSNEYGISARGGIHCAPLLHKALGTDRQGAVRFSFSSLNTIEHVCDAVRAVKEIADNYE
ncbi:MAG: aminotransferase class V-fold PLP-dependent enzyme [Firmicutes bacterium]|nr:aminotransferase class V-fold PLP-dependent enzyme [Bacillota bacterium]